MSNLPPPPSYGHLPAPPVASTPWWKKKPAIIAACILALATLGAIVGDDETDEAASEPVAAAPAPDETEVVTDAPATTAAPTTTETPTTTAAPTTTETPTTTAAPTTTAPPEPTVEERTALWVLEHLDVVDDIANQMFVTADEAGSGSAVRLELACIDLGVLVAEAQALPPIPEPTVERLFQGAMDDYQGAADACARGAAAYDVALMERSGVLMESGTAKLGEATAAIEALL